MSGSVSGRVSSVAAAADPVGATPERARCLVVTACYPAFLRDWYGAHPGLEGQTYAAQLASLVGSLFGDADFTSAALERAGFAAEDLIYNCPALQSAWARENGSPATDPVAVLVEQVRRAAPDVLYLYELGVATRPFLEAVRPSVGLIAGQIASPMPAETWLPGFDLLFSSFPHFVRRFRQAGLTAYEQPLAFDPRVAARVAGEERTLGATFVGGLSPLHARRGEVLARVAGKTALDLWGYGAHTLPADSPLRSRHHGEAWGLEMFRVLARSRITLNVHIDAAECCANNLRLFEATGCGALLVTEEAPNLPDLFEPGREVVTYRDPEECAATVRYYLEHPREAETIARAGQERTLREHTYIRRFARTADVLR
ncbi:MAG: glycosyltransferase, partial [Planctomycetes bacterium]|nr:glycosyltransferase [Planctomycetota bacterium]